MPVTTRSTSKKINTTVESMSDTKDTGFDVNACAIKRTNMFRAELIEYLKNHESLTTGAKQAESAYKIGKFLDRNLPYIFTYNKGLVWKSFACVIYNKAVEFLNLIKEKNVSETRKSEFSALWSKIKSQMMEIIINIDVDSYYALNNATYNERYEQAIQHINNNNGPPMSRSGRVKLIDYTGMDTIEPTDEDDGITDIWYDESIHYDEDWNEGDP